MNQNNKYKKIFYGNEKTPLLVTKSLSVFEKLNLEGVITPIHNLGEEAVFNYNENYKSIYDYILEKETLNLDEIIVLTIRIGKLLKKINDQDYIVGSLDLEDICFDISEPRNFLLRQCRELIKLENKEKYIKYSAGKIKITYAKYGDFSKVHYGSDVELLGKVFIKLATDRDIDTYEELRYIGHNIKLFRPDMYDELQPFINKITSIYPGEKYDNIEDAINDLQNLIKYINSKNNNELNDIITYSSICHVGDGKLQKEKDRCEDKYLNQDHCKIYEKDNKIFAFVADGVSKCTYGNGHIASRLIKNICDKNVEEKFKNINTKKDAYNFYKEIFEQSNKKIVDYINATYSSIENKDIMCSTFVGAIIIKDNLYIASIGDSRAYLMNNTISTMLTVDDNYGNECLKSGMLWSDYKSLKKKSTLTKVLGSIDNEISFTFNHIKLAKNDMVILCSDGLTDYIPNLMDMNNDWKKQEKIRDIVFDEISKNSNISKINYKLVERANKNGGFDNISSILINV